MSKGKRKSLWEVAGIWGRFCPIWALHKAYWERYAAVASCIVSYTSF